VDVVVVDRLLLEKAIDRYRSFSDKTWGLVDCASFLVMEERGITEAFTSDHDFEQAGFQCLITA
jgi:predicted nucleic acid-binding protein